MNYEFFPKSLFIKHDSSFKINMFKNQDNQMVSEKNIKEAETIIGPSLKVKGNFHGQGNIVIEGTVEGSVKTNNFLLIGSGAHITASVEAKDAKVGGQIDGDLKIDGYLEVLASAKISGNIQAKQISFEKGAQFNGNCSMGQKLETAPDKKE